MLPTMRLTRSLLAWAPSLVARAPSAPSAQVHAAADMLLPPKPLLRALLRAHRHLPSEMRALGDEYVKAEFRRHQHIDNPLHIVGFCSQWKMYLDALLADTKNPGGARGAYLDPSLLDKFSDEQLYQLYELKLATEEAFDPARAQATMPAGTNSA